jgi:capsular polysaccharide biosynthesis protein
MNFFEAVSVLRRRWYVALVLLVIAVAATAGVDKAVPSKYQSTSTISLLASRKATDGSATVPGTKNPFLSYDTSLDAMADFLVRRLESPADGLLLQGQGVTEVYSAALAAAAVGPFITLTVTGTSPQHVSDSMNTLLDFTRQQLSDIQTQAVVDPAAMIGSIVIVAPGPPTPQHKTKTQAVLGTAIAGLVMVFLGAFLAEGLAVSRRLRRRGRSSRTARAAPPPMRQESETPGAPAAGADPAGPDRPETWSRVLAGPQESRD